MYVVTNKVYLFPTSLEEFKDKVAVFEVSTLGGTSTLYLSDVKSMSGVSKLDGEESEPPMPHFGDLIYLLINLKLPGNLSMTADPTVNKISIFLPGSTSQIEITYQKSNEEYRILSTPDLAKYAVQVEEEVRKVSDRVVKFLYWVEGEEEVKEEEEDRGSLLEGVSELERMYVESERDTEEVPKSE